MAFPLQTSDGADIGASESLSPPALLVMALEPRSSDREPLEEAISQNASTAISESPSGIVGWEDGWGIELNPSLPGLPPPANLQTIQRYNTV
jgi:hypothetical protein